MWTPIYPPLKSVKPVTGSTIEVDQRWQNIPLPTTTKLLPLYLGYSGRKTCWQHKQPSHSLETTFEMSHLKRTERSDFQKNVKLPFFSLKNSLVECYYYPIMRHFCWFFSIVSLVKLESRSPFLLHFSLHLLLLKLVEELASWNGILLASLMHHHQ